VDGKRIVVGHGVETIAGSGTRKRVVVTNKLTARGRKLVERPGGVRIQVWAAITVAGSPKPVIGAGSTRLVPDELVMAPGDGLFATGSADISAKGVSFLRHLRGKLDRVKQIGCVGFNDSQGSARDNLALGQRRADAVCAFLTHIRDIASSSSSRGEGGPRATNTTTAGRAQNRRVEIRLEY
jgi:outer membrane protein OmpA-like peptidoglycan-associated protein